MARNTTGLNSTFQNPNGRSEPFILFSILICAWRPNFTFFFEFFYYLLSILQNCWSNGGCTKQWNRWINNFVKYLINSKKILKNVKFGLQAHINMENKINGSDRPFEFSNFKFEPCVFQPIYIRKHISLSLYMKYIIQLLWYRSDESNLYLSL